VLFELIFILEFLRGLTNKKACALFRVAAMHEATVFWLLLLLACSAAR
jgi:hypothetical protein